MAERILRLRSKVSSTIQVYKIYGLQELTAIKTQGSWKLNLPYSSEYLTDNIVFHGQEKTYMLKFFIYDNGVDRSEHSGGVNTVKEQEDYLTDFIYRRGAGVDLYFYDSDRRGFTGTHDGLANAAVLTDTTASFPASTFLANLIVVNVTDVSEAKITANTTTTITGTLAGGTDNDWDIGDTYEVWTGIHIEHLEFKEFGGNPNLKECILRFRVGMRAG